jgi:hypothetical protein
MDGVDPLRQDCLALLRQGDAVMRFSKIAISAVLALTLPVFAPANAQPTPPSTTLPSGRPAPLAPGTLQTKSYQPIGKNKLQVDLTVVNAGELERDLHDYFKQRLEAHGNPVGSSGTLAAKLAVEYATPLPSVTGTGANPPPPPPGVGAGGPSSQESPIPDRRAPAFTPGTPPPSAASPMHVTVTIYREQGGAVVWTGEATCNVAFKSAKQAGRTMIDQLVAAIDTTRKRDADCPL